MLDESFPTYRFQQSSENPLKTYLYFTHNGSEPCAEYILKRPIPSSAPNQYALGLVDIHYESSVVYAEVLVKPEWSQPSLSAAEIRAQGGNVPPVPLVPESFSIFLYNPDHSVVVKRIQGSWNKSESWEFEIPERSFKLPSASRIDQSSGGDNLSELAPKVVFRWKRDGRLSKDMTCYMTGRTLGGKKSKEPDITVAMFRGGKNEGVTVYEPNMRRVEVEDRKGLEEVFLLSAQVVRDLYLVPRQDAFNTAGTPTPANVGGPRGNTPPVPMASGALGNLPPPPPAPAPANGRDPRAQAAIDAETKRLKEMVANESRQAREREKRDQAEQMRIKKMLEKEEMDRQRREAEIDRETERLRREYGVTTPMVNGSSDGRPIPPPRPSSAGSTLR